MLFADWPHSSLGTLSVIALGTRKARRQRRLPPLPGRRRPVQTTPGQLRSPRTVKSAAGQLPAQVFAEPAAAKNQATAAAPADPKKQERLQKIRQLTFDRRPTAILKAWSTPREEAIKNGLNPSTAGRRWRYAGPVRNGSTGGQRRRRDDDGPECRANSGRRVHHAAGRGRRERSARPI